MKSSEMVFVQGLLLAFTPLTVGHGCYPSSQDQLSTYASGNVAEAASL